MREDRGPLPLCNDLVLRLQWSLRVTEPKRQGDKLPKREPANENAPARRRA